MRSAPLGGPEIARAVGRLPDHRNQALLNHRRQLAQYFAALEAIRTQAAWTELLADPFSLKHADIVVAAAAFLDVIRGDDARRDELLMSVIRHSRRKGRYSSIHPGLVGRLLVETEHVGTELYRQLADRWVHLVVRCTYGVEGKIAVEETGLELLSGMATHPRAADFRRAITAAGRGSSTRTASFRKELARWKPTSP